MKTKLLLAALLIINYCSAQYTKLYDFDSINGSNPVNTLIFVGPFMYGMTVAGGISDSGTVFKIKPDGTGYTKLLDFAGTASGKWPEGSLFSDGTFLYGMTWGGGTSDSGTVFKIKLDGTGYLKLLDFNGSNGSSPQGSFISDGTFLYGTTGTGGIHGLGTIFKIMTDGTGYSKLIDFDGATKGDLPIGSLFSDGIFLYGMTIGGGTSNFGTLFKIKTDGTGFLKLLDFSGLNGRNPFGNDLISDGTFLYGMTYRGGINNMGVIFKIKPDGTGYATLLDFAGITNGANPEGSLFFDGTFLYGMGNGGTNNIGVFFKIKPDGTGFVKLIDFTGTTDGGLPFGSLISDGTSLFGMAAIGGVNDKGTIFKYTIAPNAINENNENFSFNIFPNPNNGTFSITTKENYYRLLITNVLLENIFQSEIKNAETEIDLSNLPNGIYFLNLKTEKGVISKKLIINK